MWRIHMLNQAAAAVDVGDLGATTDSQQGNVVSEDVVQQGHVDRVLERVDAVDVFRLHDLTIKAWIDV